MLKSLSLLRERFREDNVFGVLFLLCLTVPLAFTLDTYEHFEMIKTSLLFVFAGWALAALVVKSARERAGRISFRGQRLLFILLGLWWLFAAVAAVWSLDHANSVFGFYTRFSNGWLFYSALALFAAVCLAALDREKYVLILKVLVFDAFAISVVGLLQSVGIGFYQGLDVTDAFQRAPSLLGNPNFSTMFIITLLPLALWFWFDARSLGEKIYYGLSSFFIIWCTVILASRGALLGLLVVLCINVFALAVYKLKRSALVFFGVFLLVSLGFIYGFTQLTRPTTFSATVNLSDNNIDQRFEVWSLSFKQIMQHPLGGVGLGNFQIFFEQHRDKHLAAIGGIFDDAHNLFLQFAVTGGAQFALAFLGLLGFALWQYSGTARRGDDIALAAASGIIGFAVMACFNPVPAPCLLACMLLVAGSGLQSDREFKFTLPRPAAWAAAGAGALLILAGLDLAVSEHIFFAGRNAYLAGDYPSAARLSRLASTLNPTNQLSYVYYAGSLININPLDPQVPDAIRRAIAAHPTTGVSYSLAATLDFRAALRSGVLEYYNQSVANMMLAINHDPYFPLRYTRLGYIYLRGGRFDEAREALKQSLALDDSSVPSWVMLAKVYQLQGKRQQVIAALTEGFKRQPGIEDLSQLLKKAKQEPDVSRMPIPLQGEGGPIE